MNEVPDGGGGVNGKVIHIERSSGAFDAERQADIRRTRVGGATGP